MDRKEKIRAGRAARLNPNKAGPKNIIDRHKIMADMKAWCKKESSINFVGFCAEFEHTPARIWRLEQEYEDFEMCYQFVRMRLAERRERLMNQGGLNYGSWARYQAIYDPFLFKAEEDDKDREAARKIKIVDNQQANLVSLAELAAKGKIKQKK